MAQGAPSKFAVFDIDGTVIRWQLYHAIVGELAKQGHLQDHAYETIQQARLTWKQREQSDSYDAYEQVLVNTYLSALKNLKVTDYLAAVDKVFEEYKDQVYTYTRDLIRDLKADGYVLFAISGSQHEIIEKLAKYYGFDDYRGSLFEQENGHFTGEVHTPYGRKLELLQNMVEEHNLSFEGSIGIGDATTDIPLLEAVEKPVAFNPNQKLLEAATEHGWPIVLERKNVVYHLEAQDGTYRLRTN